MTKVGVISYEYRIIYSILGPPLIFLSILAVDIFDIIGASAVSYIIHFIIAAPGYLFGRDLIKLLSIMFFWSIVGFLVGYVKDLRNARKMLTKKRSVTNKKMTIPNIDNRIKTPEKNIKENVYTLRDCITIFSIILCPSFIGLALVTPLWYVHGPDHTYRCMNIETDAQNTLAALASYFSDPDKNELPTVQDLMRSEDLIIRKNSTVIIDGPRDEIRVTVIDNKNRCVRGNRYEVYMGGTWGEWYGE